VDEIIASVAPALQAKIGAYRREHRLPGIVAGIADRDGLRWWHASGFADIESGRRPDEHTLYRVASITKTFTATAVLQLRDEGRLRLDDPAVRFVPEMAAITNAHGPIEDLTIRRLLMHTSGLQGEVPWQDTDRIWLYTPAQMLEVVRLAHVRTPPETDHKYSNFAYELLGVVVERVAGRPYAERVRATVLDPLGMADTTWDPDADQGARTAVGYDARAHDDVPPPARRLEAGLFQADGGLWSTVEDLGRWIAQQLRAEPELERGDGQVLRGATLAEMHRPSFVGKADWTEAQGLGWYGTRTGETVLVGHSGALWGFLTNISFSVTGKVGAIVLLNGVGSPAPLARELVEALLPAIKEAGDRAEVPPVVPVPEAWRELLGEYRDPEFGDGSVIEWRDGKLVLLDDRPGMPSHELVATDEPLVFTLRGGRPGGEPLVFARGADGRIDRCNMGGYPAMRVDLLRPPTWT
jgi:CubicO group peptidase (beta-lactamase class C family)